MIDEAIKWRGNDIIMRPLSEMSTNYLAPILTFEINWLLALISRFANWAWQVASLDYQINEWSNVMNINSFLYKMGIKFKSLKYTLKELVIIIFKDENNDSISKMNYKYIYIFAHCGPWTDFNNMMIMSALSEGKFVR